MDIRSRIISQDDIKVKFEIEMTIGEIRSIVGDIDPAGLRSPSIVFLNTLKSVSYEVNRIFWPKEEDEE